MHVLGSLSFIKELTILQLKGRKEKILFLLLNLNLTVGQKYGLFVEPINANIFALRLFK